MRFIIEQNGVTAVETKDGKTYHVFGATKAEAIRRMQEKLDPNRKRCLICGRPREADSPFERCCC